MEQKTTGNHLSLPGAKYWHRALSNGIELSTFPWRRSDRAHRSSEGAVEIPFEHAALAALHRFGDGSELQQFIAVLACLKICLSQYSGAKSVAVSTPRRRQAAPNDGGISPAGTVVVIDEVVDDLPFREFLKNVRRTHLDAYAHQDDLAADLPKQLGLTTRENQPLTKIAALHLAVHVALPAQEFDAALILEPTTHGLKGRIVFNAGLFDTSTVERAAVHISSVLTAAMSDPDRRLIEFDLLTAEERQIALAWSGNSFVNGEEAATDICEAFCLQARRTPEAVAVSFGDAQLTYRTLDDRSDMLAFHLRDLGLNGEDRVGIRMERSLDQITAVLGVLKAGLTYVPIDTALPAARAGLIADSSGILALIRDEAPVDELPVAFDPSFVVCLGRDWPRIASRSSGAAKATPMPANLAYCLYTSGSTGRPKGVAQTRGCLSNLVDWHRRTYLTDHSARTLQFASLGFDVSFQEIFTTLCGGGTLVLIDEKTRRDSASLLRVLSSERITQLFLSFAGLLQLASAAEREGDIALELEDLFAAGEQLQVSPTIVKFFRRTRGCRLHNQYGPTETHVATAHSLEGAPSRWERLPPIGKAIGHTTVLLVDDRMRLVPLGAPGELCVGGIAVARGYLDWPDMTATKFVPCPFGISAGGRLYRTGDLGRFRPDGTIEFLGRLDDQLKVRGYRIEPGEVEAALVSHPAVREAVVVGRDGDQGGRHLAAYLVLHKDQPITLESLRSALRTTLPDYAIPTEWIEVESFPLTSSNKVDRRRLPTPSAENHVAADSFVAPRSPEERKIANIWAEALKRDRVSIHDNFFDVGGHSLLAVQVVAQMKETLNADISLTSFFEALTIERLGDMLRLQALDVAESRRTNLGHTS